jgi:hypothetical protein
MLCGLEGACGQPQKRNYDWVNERAIGSFNGESDEGFLGFV